MQDGQFRHQCRQMGANREFGERGHGRDDFRQVGAAAEIALDQHRHHQVAQAPHGGRQRGAGRHLGLQNASKVGRAQG